METTSKPAKLPESFRQLFWSYNFDKLNLERHKQRIIINTVNYGGWKHWQELVKLYGAEEIMRTISHIPRSEFRARALRLISLLLDFDINNMKLVRSSHS